MASKLKSAAAARTISDALALSHFIVANILVVLGEFTPLFSFIDDKHPGMAFVKTYLDAPAVTFLNIYWAFAGAFGFLTIFVNGAKHGDTSDFTLWLAIESIIMMASFLYWILCYFCTRAILAVSQ